MCLFVVCIIQLLMSELPSGNSSGMKQTFPVLPALPLDLRCNGVNGRPSNSPSQRGCTVTVSRRCAPPVVPANTAPSTSLPRSSSPSIITTVKVNRQRSVDRESASSSAAVGVSRKCSRDVASLTPSPTAPSTPEKLARIPSQSPEHTGAPQQSAVRVEAVTSDDGPAADEHLSSASSSPQHPATVALAAVASETATSNPVSLPVVLTSVNGMLVPLSSAPAAIIVVNCPTATSPPASQTSSRLCPIAPAPPPTTKQSEQSTMASSASGLLSTDRDITALSSLAAKRRMYTCEEPGCGKTYYKNSHLKVHRRVHTGLCTNWCYLIFRVQCIWVSVRHLCFLVLVIGFFLTVMFHFYVCTYIVFAV